jgi:hypothetical protein
MRPLTVDDLLPLGEYAPRRREFFESHARYLDRYRRVRIGPAVTLVFENRQTLWFRVQEIIRIARLAEADQIQQELNVYNRLLPGANCLQAAFLIEVKDETRLAEELGPWSSLRGEELSLCIGPTRLPASLTTCRPEDRTLGAAHWAGFEVPGPSRRMLAAFHMPVRCEVSRTDYQHESLPLSSEVRQSLLDDLEMSDRD